MSVTRSIFSSFEAATRPTSVGKDKITVTEARKLVGQVTADGVVTAEEKQAMNAALSRYRDSFSASGALEFSFLAQQAGVTSALPAPASGTRAQAVKDAFISRVTTGRDGSRTVGVSAVRAAYAEALRDGSLSSDEKVGLARLEAMIQSTWRVSSSAARELAQIRANHRLPNLPLGDAAGAAR